MERKRKGVFKSTHPNTKVMHEVLIKFRKLDRLTGLNNVYIFFANTYVLSLCQFKLQNESIDDQCIPKLYDRGT